MQKPSEPTTKPESPDDDVSVTEVAILLGLRYHKARDAMLQGKMGEAKYAPLTVKRREVMKFRELVKRQRLKRS